MRSGAEADVEEIEKIDCGDDHPWKTILFNCECHTFEQVEAQLIKAIRCPLGKARAIAWEVHSKGLSVVYVGVRERAEAVAEVLASIGLVVKVAQ